jgi:hypothetical protein
LAHSVTARNALGVSEENAREIATMLYGEVHPYGYFRFVDFGHPPPLAFSAEYRKFVELDKIEWSNSCHWVRRSPQIIGIDDKTVFIIKCG